MVVKNKFFGDVLHRQIAGALAKRIVNYAKEGQTVTQASESGFIKFGSRVGHDDVAQGLSAASRKL